MMKDTLLLSINEFYQYLKIVKSSYRVRIIYLMVYGIYGSRAIKWIQLTTSYDEIKTK